MITHLPICLVLEGGFNMYDFKNTGDVMQFPSIAVVGYLGAGKTAITTFIALMFKKYCDQYGLKDYKVFANYNIDLPNFKKVKAHDIVSFAPWLKNGILIIDEIHSENGDSYNFLGAIEKKMTTFFTQIRKRNLAVITTTQDMSFILPRIRRLTYYYIHVVKQTDTKSLMRIVSRNGYTLINEIPVDLSMVYDIFDTNEIITPEEIKEIEKLTTENDKKS